MHSAGLRIVMSIVFLYVLSYSSAMAQRPVSREQTEADTLTMSASASNNPWDTFYPVPPGAELVVPGTKPEASQSAPATAGFTIQLAAAKGCDTSCHKPVARAAMRRKR